MRRALRVPLEGLAPGSRELSGEVARYILRVHRLRAGDRLSCFDPVQALEAEAEISSTSADRLECSLYEVRASGYRALPVLLLQGLAKGAKPEAILAEATALGIARIVFMETEHAVVHLADARAAARRERWQRIAAQAARQSGRGNLPLIEGPISFAQALQIAAERRLLLTPGGSPLLGELAGWHSGEAMALLVGPEGGFSSSESEQARAHGYVEASLGRTTLRTELAAVAALGALVAFAELSKIG
jgi:16S rRNA (uracil1498-N3)-methyltransferase